MATIIDAFRPEDRMDVTFSQFYTLMKESAKAELMMNGIKNKLDYDAIYTMMTGEHLPEPCVEVKEPKNTRK